ncbi:AAA domain [Actinoalloteichus hymeniacidonis]|uniref:AAA domain n=2 Tax=Actinoalloteichus hymeniacidonis TaxID=340345 RepID=A0AAC9HNV5_9PSEU|nr:AAA domain [Actinoalloteichus hymeniacidonis]
MLRRFRLGNHRSFHHAQDWRLSGDHDTSARPVAGVYGANAAGKSNLLDGLRFMALAVTGSFDRWPEDGGVARRPFRLDQAAALRPSSFEVELVIDGVGFGYGFDVDDEKVRHEWLHRESAGQRRLLLDRDVEGVRHVAGESESELERAAVLGALTRPNTLLLSVAAQSHLDWALPVYRWFARQLVFVDVSRRSAAQHHLVDLLRTSPELRAPLVELLRLADLGIADVVLEEEVLHQDPLVAGLLERLQSAHATTSGLPDEDTAAGPDFGLDVPLDPSEASAARLAANAAARTPSREDESRSAALFFAHGAGRTRFEWEEESEGTQSCLELLPQVLRALIHGRTLIVDEIDTSLHPGLTRRLVALFRDAAAAGYGGQLLFTTHDTTLMRTPIAADGLDREEIWFVDKDAAGSSTLHSPAEFRVTDGAQRGGPATEASEEGIEAAYLAGRFGAIPVVDGADFLAAVRAAIDAGRRHEG